jgi:hypothetical protein
MMEELRPTGKRSRELPECDSGHSVSVCKSLQGKVANRSVWQAGGHQPENPGRVQFFLQMIGCNAGVRPPASLGVKKSPVCSRRNQPFAAAAHRQTDGQTDSGNCRIIGPENAT